MSVSIREFCNPKIVVIRQEDDIVEAAKRMREYHVGSLVVVEGTDENPIPIGMITDRDIIVEIIAKELPLGSVTVGDVMSYELAVVDENDDLWETIQRMQLNGVRRLPVVSAGRLVGIISVDDLLAVIAGEFLGLVNIISSEQEREVVTRPS